MPDLALVAGGIVVGFTGLLGLPVLMRATTARHFMQGLRSLAIQAIH